MSTSKIGFIVSSFDIMGVVATPTLSYMGSRYNKCKIIGTCGFFYVVGAIIYTFPYFFSPHYMVTIDTSLSASMYNRTNFSAPFDSTVDMCKNHNLTSSIQTTTPNMAIWNSENPLPTISVNFPSIDHNKTNGSRVCNRTTSAVSWTYAMFIIAQLFMSIGSAPLFSLGITYLTDNIEERKHAFYTGICSYLFLFYLKNRPILSALFYFMSFYF